MFFDFDVYGKKFNSVKFYLIFYYKLLLSIVEVNYLLVVDINKSFYS